MSSFHKILKINIKSQNLLILMEYNILLTHVVLDFFSCIFRHLKLELLTQFPASNDKKLLLFNKNKHLPNQIFDEPLQPGI